MEYRSQGLLLGLILAASPGLASAQGFNPLQLAESQLCEDNPFDYQRALELEILPETCGGTAEISAPLCGGAGPDCESYYHQYIPQNAAFGVVPPEGRMSQSGKYFVYGFLPPTESVTLVKPNAYFSSNLPAGLNDQWAGVLLGETTEVATTLGISSGPSGQEYTLWGRDPAQGWGCMGGPTGLSGRRSHLEKDGNGCIHGAVIGSQLSRTSWDGEWANTPISLGSLDPSQGLVKTIIALGPTGVPQILALQLDGFNPDPYWAAYWQYGDTPMEGPLPVAAADFGTQFAVGPNGEGGDIGDPHILMGHLPTQVGSVPNSLLSVTTRENGLWTARSIVEVDPSTYEPCSEPEDDTAPASCDLNHTVAMPHGIVFSDDGSPRFIYSQVLRTGEMSLECFYEYGVSCQYVGEVNYAGKLMMAWFDAQGQVQTYEIQGPQPILPYGGNAEIDPNGRIHITYTDRLSQPVSQYPNDLHTHVVGVKPIN